MPASHEYPARESTARLPALRRLSGVVALVMLVIFATPSLASEQTDRRVLMGLKMFPALLATDQDLAQKREASGELRIILLYREDPVTTNAWAQRLASAETIGEMPVTVDILPYSKLTTLKEKPPAALFLAEWSPADLAATVRFGIEHRRIVFSPFKGDVRKGASAGIYITDRMLPLVNIATLEAADIRLHSFLLEVAKTYE